MIARENGATHDCELCGRPIRHKGWCVGCEADLDHGQDDYYYALNQEDGS